MVTAVIRAAARVQLHALAVLAVVGVGVFAVQGHVSIAIAVRSAIGVKGRDDLVTVDRAKNGIDRSVVSQTSY